jgi:hypothetical protein
MVSVEWSPDGRSLLCETRAGLFRIPKGGGTAEPLPFPDAAEPSAAQRGGRLVYVRSTRDVDIFALPGQGGRGAPVAVISSTRMDGAPSYSSDGKRIAFVSDRTGSNQVWVSDIGGQFAEQVTASGVAIPGCPRWSPDGQSIAFDSTSPSGSHIFVVRVKGGDERQVTAGNSSDVRPSWSHDGRWIYFGSNRTGRWEIWKSMLDSAPAVQVTRNGGREAFEDSGGKFVYYTKEQSARGIWRSPVSGGPEEMVTDHGSQGRWAMGERGLYYLKGDADLERLALPEGTVVPIPTAGLQLATGTGGLLAIGPGERPILVTASVRMEGDLMLVEGFR